jgi:Ni,Fe-hydrogenase I cytochrome b subunit
MVRIVIRVAGLAAVLAISYGIAAVLPAGIEAVIGYLAVGIIVFGAFGWALRDGRDVHVSDAIRDWLVVAFVVAVLWRVSLVLFEGSDDVIAQLRRDFIPLLSTIGLIFAPALFGALQGNGSRPTTTE